MIFEALWEASKRGELLLVEGGFCHWHKRRDGQLTIREIISTRPGAGSEMLARLKLVPGITKIVARCPADLEANAWYARRGFQKTASQLTKTGREVLTWELGLA